MRKAWVGIVATIAILSAAGIGFAAFTSSVYVNATASNGNVNLLWVAPASSLPVALSSSTGTCSAYLAGVTKGPAPFSYSSNSIAFTTSGFVPADYCIINFGPGPGLLVTNLGGLPATLSESATCAINGGSTTPATFTSTGSFGAPAWTCGNFEFTDTFIMGGIASPLAPGATSPYAASVDLAMGTSPTAPPQFIAFDVSLTGSA